VTLTSIRFDGEPRAILKEKKCKVIFEKSPTWLIVIGYSNVCTSFKKGHLTQRKLNEYSKSTIATMWKIYT
jgi:hypothetical protein